MENKKVKNATPRVYNGIHFKSLIEVMVYKTLLENGINACYEHTKFKLWEGVKPTIKYYTKSRSGFNLNKTKLIDITYTPDFIIELYGYIFIIEVKGFINDTFPIKFKMFRKLLEGMDYKNKIVLFEVFSKKDTLKVIEIIKSYGITENKRID